MTQLADATLYLVAPGQFPSDVLESVIEAGVDIVQLRMKEDDASHVITQAARFDAACSPRGVPLVINDRPDIAVAVDADGVHLGQDDLPPTVARTILGPRAIIGRSTHTHDDVDRALDEHDAGLCDYVAVGPVYETPTKPGRPGVGLDLVRYAAERVSFPWFAIGGIDESNIGDVKQAGARRVVVVRAITLVPDPAAAAARLARALA